MIVCSYVVTIVYVSVLQWEHQVHPRREKVCLKYVYKFMFLTIHTPVTVTSWESLISHIPIEDRREVDLVRVLTFPLYTLQLRNIAS